MKGERSCCCCCCCCNFFFFLFLCNGCFYYICVNYCAICRHLYQVVTVDLIAEPNARFLPISESKIQDKISSKTPASAVSISSCYIQWLPTNLSDLHVNGFQTVKAILRLRFSLHLLCSTGASHQERHEDVHFHCQWWWSSFLKNTSGWCFF